AADMYELASERLLAAGFWHYEISNWARGLTPAPDVWALPPGGVSEGIGPWVAHHNLIYWRTQRWLGLGAGAHSWLGARRGCNLLHPEAYIAALHGGNSVEAEGEEISGRLEMGETMMMGLRLAEGVTDAAFRARFGVGLEDGYRSVLDRFSALGLLLWDGARVRLTAQGRLLGNQVFAEFLL
ncbi:MAG: coproporphyrinogen III oxidase family protein, partial [Anaerolineae bacterium]|nr:coproporphyrinogen III oxidase family protein [Anaerolineae bacterium]